MLKKLKLKGILYLKKPCDIIYNSCCNEITLSGHKHFKNPHGFTSRLQVVHNGIKQYFTHAACKVVCNLIIAKYGIPD